MSSGAAVRLRKGGSQMLQWKAWPKVKGVYVASLAGAGLLPSGVPALRVDGRRSTRARYPNANPERDLFPTGWIPV